MFTKPHSFSLSFIRKEQLSHETFAFYFDRVKRGSGRSEDWDFHPGQYIQMMLPHQNADERGTMRYFTISSSPLEKQYLRITTKVIQSTFKMTLASLKPGDEVSFYGPSGDFYLQEKKQSHVFLSGGVGINPFISMFEYVASTKKKIALTLLASFSNPLERIYVDELTKMNNAYTHMNIVYTMTGNEGRISPLLIQKHVTDIQKPIYYIVGPPGMVTDTVTMLDEMGISEDRILQEHFSGY